MKGRPGPRGAGGGVRQRCGGMDDQLQLLPCASRRLGMTQQRQDALGLNPRTPFLNDNDRNLLVTANLDGTHARK